MLRVGGQRHHVAHTVLLLLRMLQAYMTFQQAVPLLAAETARRAADLLKVTSFLHYFSNYLQTYLQSSGSLQSKQTLGWA